MIGIVLGCLLAGSTANALSVSGLLNADAFIVGNSFEAKTFYEPLPFAGTLHLDDYGAALTTLDAGFSLGNDALEITVDGAGEAHSLTTFVTNGRVSFTVDEPVGYRMEGAFGIAQPDSVPRNVILEAGLFGPPGTTLFDSYQESRATLDESFVLGLEEGDYGNRSSGSPVGMLMPGDYVLSFGIYAAQQLDPDPAAVTGSGFLRLTFVPEPSTALLLLLTASVGVARLRRGTRPRSPARDPLG